MADVDAWMPLWIGDYLADTGDLTTEEHGAYLLLLMAMWRQGGRLPGDPDKLARMAKVAQRRWAAVWAAIGRFFDVSGDSVVQGRLVIELAAATQRHDRFSARGRKGAAAKHATSLLEAENKQPLSTSQVVLESQPLRGDGDCSGSAPSLSSPLSRLPDQTPARVSTGAIWKANDWCRRYGNAWTDKYGGFYGMASDSKGCAALFDLLQRMPTSEVLAAQADASRMFVAFLSSGSVAVLEARHPFAFFVTAFGGLRVPEQPPRIGQLDPRIGHARAEVKTRTTGEVKL